MTNDLVCNQVNRKVKVSSKSFPRNGRSNIFLFTYLKFIYIKIYIFIFTFLSTFWAKGSVIRINGGVVQHFYLTKSGIALGLFVS